MELDPQQSKAARHQIDRIQSQLRRIDEEILPEKKPHVEPSATHHDSGTEHAAREQTGDRARAGSLVGVHEELVASGAELSYTAVTAFCRRHGIGYALPAPAGRYDFAAGEEMQHDTSPHELELCGKKRK